MFSVSDSPGGRQQVVIPIRGVMSSGKLSGLGKGGGEGGGKGFGHKDSIAVGLGLILFLSLTWMYFVHRMYLNIEEPAPVATPGAS